MSREDAVGASNGVDVAGLRGQIEQLLSLSQQFLQDERVAQPRPGEPQPAAPPPPRAADLKRLIQLRAQRRREPMGSFLEWPAWDMLLDLAAVGAEAGHISVSAICISSGAPQSTALRKLAQLERAGLVKRYLHDADRRRVSLMLTPEGIRLVHSRLAEDWRFYSEVSQGAGRPKPAPARPGLVLNEAGPDRRDGGG